MISQNSDIVWDSIKATKGYDSVFLLVLLQDNTNHPSYFNLLHDFASTFVHSLSSPILTSLHDHLPPSHTNILARPFPEATLGPPSMISYKTIHQTDKSKDQMTWETEEWIKYNAKDGWKLNFLDDEMAWKWVNEKFRMTDVEWSWSYMHRGVLRADFLRYLLPLVEGGVYSDVDVSYSD